LVQLKYDPKVPGGIICPFATGVGVKEFGDDYLTVLNDSREKGESVVVFDLRKKFGDDVEDACDFLDAENKSESLRDVLLFNNELLPERAYVSIFGDYKKLELSSWIPYAEFHPRHYSIPMVVFLFADTVFSEKAQYPIGLHEATRVCQMFYGVEIIQQVNFEWIDGDIDVVRNDTGWNDSELELIVSLYRANKAGFMNVSFEDFCNVASRKDRKM
jgi:hypothetical protein